jgi:hypothetical protein
MISGASVHSFVNFSKFCAFSDEYNYEHGALLKGVLKKEKKYKFSMLM